MDLISFMVVVWFLKVLAEDAYSTAKGTPNPRTERRKQRQRTRSNNRIWGALTDYLGDVAEDAREQAVERRKAKREARRQAPKPTVEPVPVPPAVDSVPQPDPFRVVDLDLDDPSPGFWDLGPRDCTECGEPGEMVQREDGRTFTHDRTGDRCPALDPDLASDPSNAKDDGAPGPGSPSPVADSDIIPPATVGNVIPFRAPSNKKENDMSTQTNGEVTGLDPAIEYAKSLAGFAGEHGQAGNEGYIGFLTESMVKGEALGSAHEMQAAFAAAQAAAERHQQELEKQKQLQEAYNQNPDAGDKGFLLNGQ